MNFISTVLLTSVATTALISTGCSSSNNASDTVANTPISDAQNSANDVADDFTVDTSNMNQPSLILDNVAYQLIELLGGYSLTLTGKQIATIGDIATTTAIGSTVLDSNNQFLVVGIDNDPAPIDTTQYACEQGGEMTISKAFYGQHSPSFSRSVEQTEYHFEQCRLSSDGEQTLDGSVLLFDDLIFDTEGNSTDRLVRWTDFTWTKGDGFTLKLNASIKLTNSDLVVSRSMRDVRINRYELFAGNQPIESVKDSNFVLSIQTSNEGDVQDYSLIANGRATELSAVGVEITTDPTMTRKLVSEGLGVDAVLFNGQITMVAEDRSELILEATSSQENNTLQVDSSYTDSDGNLTLLKGQNFVDLTVSAF